MTVVSYLVNAILVALGIIFFSSQRKDLFCVILYLILSSGIGFIPVSMPTTDWAMVLCFGTYFLDVLRCRHLGSLSGDSLGCAILAMVGYVVLRSLVSLFIYEETLGHILLTIRSCFFWLSYFLLKKISYNDFLRSWNKLCVLIFLSCFFNLLQYVGFSLGNYHSCSFGARLGMPLVAYLLFFWCFVDLKTSFLYRGILGTICLISIACTGSRFNIVLVLILTVFVAFTRIKLKNKKIGFVIVLFFIASAAFLVVQSNVLNNVGRFSEIKNDVQTISDVSQTTAVKGKYLESGSGATMTFRLVLAKERIQYLLRNPQYLIWGIGPIYDDPGNGNNRFNFYLGTIRSDRNGIHQIETVDIAFVTHFFRYGILGLFLYILVLITMTKLFYNNLKDMAFAKSSLFVIVLYELQCLGANFFDRFQFMAFLIVVAGVISYEKKVVRNCNTKLQHS